MSPHRRSCFGFLAWLLLATLSLPVGAYNVMQPYLDGRYRTAVRTSSPVRFRVNMSSLSSWLSMQGLDKAGRMELANRVLRTTIEAYETWEQVPWATIEVEYDGASTAVVGSRNGVNDVFFDATTSWAFWWWINTGSDAGKIYEGDVRLDVNSINGGMLGPEAVQETGHVLGLNHSIVSNLFSRTTDNASVSVGVNAANDAILSQDDIAGISVMYPVVRRRREDGLFGGPIIESLAHEDDFGTIRGRVGTFFWGRRQNGAAVLAVDLATGGAVIGELSGTYNLPTVGASGTHDVDGTGEFELPCLPPGTYAIVACPLLNYLTNTERVRSGFMAATTDALFEPGVQVVTVAAGEVVSGVLLDGNSGDLDRDSRWTSMDLALFDSFRADPGQYDWFTMLVVANLCDLNNSGGVDLDDRRMLERLIGMTNRDMVEASVF